MSADSANDANAKPQDAVEADATPPPSQALPQERTAPPPRKPAEKPAWMLTLRKVQRRMLFIGFPIAALLLAATWFMREVEARTFHVAPWIEGGAVRTVLLASGLKEVRNPDDATILWSDDHATADRGRRKRRVSMLPGQLSGRPDAGCAAITAATRRLHHFLANASRGAAVNSSGGEGGSDGGNSASGEAVADESPGTPTPAAPPRVTTCYLLPRQRDALREAMMAEDGGSSFWELRAADAMAHGLQLDGRGGAAAVAPAVTNNPDSLPKGGTWVVRRVDPKPLLLHGHRVSVQIFGLISSVDPLRVYVHHDAIVWRAARRHDPEQPHLDLSEASQRLGPRHVSTGSLSSPWRGTREVLPIGSLWLALEERGVGAPTSASADAPKEPHETWRAIERVAVVGAAAALDDTAAKSRAKRAAAAARSSGGIGSSLTNALGSALGMGGEASGGVGRDLGSMNGYSTHFTLLDMQINLDEDLVPSLVSVSPMPEMADGLANQPLWHREAMRRVVSDSLNLTGATLHPRRRGLFIEMRSQLSRALKPKRNKKTALTPSSRARHTKASKKEERRRGAHAVGGPETRREKKRGALSSMFGRGEAADKTPAPCKLVLPVASTPGEAETCLSAADVDMLTQSDVEYLWRFGWRRVVPGMDEDVRTAVRMRGMRDGVLAKYLSRWPKEEVAYSVPPWAEELARQLQREEGGGEKA